MTFSNAQRGFFSCQEHSTFHGGWLSYLHQTQVYEFVFCLMWKVDRIITSYSSSAVEFGTDALPY